MMDFVVRETRAILLGPVAILRLGTCGGLGLTEPGTIVVAGGGALQVRREPDVIAEFLKRGSPPPADLADPLPYTISGVAMPNGELAGLVGWGGVAPCWCYSMTPFVTL